MSDEMVPFTQSSVTGYLDKAIRFWRRKHDDAPDTPAGDKLRVMASHYVDAYQSVRSSLFGDTLPIEEGEKLTDYNKVLGQNLRNARFLLDLSLDSVAMRTGGEFKASVVGAYERGERALTVVRLHNLCAFYGIKLIDVLPIE